MRLIKHVALAVFVLFNVSTTWANEDIEKSCSSVLHTESEKKAQKDERRLALTVIPKFNAYFAAARLKNLESEYLVDLGELALLAEEHLLLLGPPGNAKSQFADSILGNMIEESTGKPSYFRIQMTPETTLSETHGPLDYKKLTKTNKYDRVQEEGMNMYRNVFTDEQFDARDNALRNVLGLYAERAHAQGPHITKGKIETVIAASNKYLSEVYERAKSDGPKAIIDRFALVAFVPVSFEHTKSYTQLIQGTKRDSVTFPQFTFEELERLRDLVQQVTIPEPVAKLLALVSKRMRAETEPMELNSLKEQRTKLKNGEEAPIPYRATKFHSKRTIGKAGLILRAIVVQDWIRKNGHRRLTATTEDLVKMNKFFGLNGPSEALVKSELKSTSNPHERAQLRTILQESEIFFRVLNTAITEMDQVAVEFGLSDISASVAIADSKEEKEQAAKVILTQLSQLAATTDPNSPYEELGPAEIGRDYVRGFLRDSLVRLVSSDVASRLEAEMFARIESQRQAVIREAEEARVREKNELRRKEKEERSRERLARREQERRTARRKEIVEKFSSPESFDVGYLKVDSLHPGEYLVSLHTDEHRGVMFGKNENSLFYFDLDKKTEDGKLFKVSYDTVVPDGHTANIQSVHFVDEKIIVFISNDGKAVHTFNISDLSATSFATSVNPAVSAYDPTRKKVISLDIFADRLIFTDITNGSNEFMSLKTDASTPDKLDEASIKGSLSADEHRTFLVSDDGKYAVVAAPSKSQIAKIDLSTGVLTALPNLKGTSGFNVRPDPRILTYNRNHLTFVNVSGPNPVVTHVDGLSLDNDHGVAVDPESGLIFGAYGSISLAALDLNESVEVDFAYGLPSNAWTSGPQWLSHKVLAVFSAQDNEGTLRVIRVKSVD